MSRRAAAVTRWRLADLAAAAALLLGATTAQAQTDPGAWVIGQSLPLTGPAFPTANRVLAAARVAVEQVNAAGGVAGRRLELVTHDDGGDPRRLDTNLERLVREQGALAIVNCLGERACRVAAEAARRTNVPLLGAFSGDDSLRAPQHPDVFTLRPTAAQESLGLQAQLLTLGLSRIVMVADGDEPGREAALAATLRAAGLKLAVETVARDSGEAGLRQAFERAASADPQALLLVLGPDSLDRLGRVDRTHAWPALPALLLTTSSPWITQVLRLFRERAIGFTAVVPNPESSQLPLVREFDAAIERLGGPEALSFEGLSAYLHVRLVAEALRRSGRTPLAASIKSWGRVSVGGFELRFGAGHQHGSDSVEIGVRTRDGRARR